MRINIIISIGLVGILITTCSVNDAVIYSADPNEKQLDANNEPRNKQVQYFASGSSVFTPLELRYCCNNSFPAPGDSSATMTIIYCPGGPEDHLAGGICACYWSHLVTNPNADLGYKACIDRPDSIKAVETLVGENKQGHPRLSWSFVYGHGYTIKKKVGGGSWDVVHTITENTTTIWTDTDQNLPPQRTIYYRIYTKLFNSLATTAPQVRFDPPSK